MQQKAESSGEVTIEQRTEDGASVPQGRARRARWWTLRGLWGFKFEYVDLSSLVLRIRLGDPGLLPRLLRRLRRVQRPREVRLRPVHAGPRQTAPTRRAATPSEAPSQRREEIWSKVGVFCYYVCSLSVQAIPCGILRDQRTDSTLRVGQQLTKGAQR